MRMGIGWGRGVIGRDEDRMGTGQDRMAQDEAEDGMGWDTAQPAPCA